MSRFDKNRAPKRVLKFNVYNKPLVEEDGHCYNTNSS